MAIEQLPRATVEGTVADPRVGVWSEVEPNAGVAVWKGRKAAYAVIYAALRGEAMSTDDAKFVEELRADTDEARELYNDKHAR